MQDIQPELKKLQKQHKDDKEQLKQILLSTQQPKRDFKINRV